MEVPTPPTSLLRLAASIGKDFPLTVKYLDMYEVGKDLTTKETRLRGKEEFDNEFFKMSLAEKILWSVIGLFVVFFAVWLVLI